MKAVTTFYANDGKSFRDEAECKAYDAEQLKIGQEQYSLRLKWNIVYSLKDQYKPVYITCPYCNGNGTVGGGFKSIDGPETCPQCYGTMSVIDREKSPVLAEPPPVPSDLHEYMRQKMQIAWDEYWKEKKK